MNGSMQKRYCVAVAFFAMTFIFAPAAFSAPATAKQRFG